MSEDRPTGAPDTEPSVPPASPAPGLGADSPPWPEMTADSPTLATDTTPTDPSAARAEED